MASIFHLPRDKGKRRKAYWIEYTNELGKRQRKKGFTDYRLTEQLAAKIEDEVRLKTSGLVDPLIEGFANHRTTAVIVHLRAYAQHLRRGSRTLKYRKLAMRRVRNVVAGANIKSLADLQADRVDRYLHSLHEQGFGARTLNHYGQAMGGWTRWLVKTNRLAANPLHSVTTYNAEADVRHKRRALTTREVSNLVESARQSGQKIQAYSPELRARLYELAFYTGLRRKELASLTPVSFDLKSVQPTVTVAAACSKHRRTDVLPLHPHLLKSLSAWLHGMKPNEPLFPGLAGKKTWLMVKKDLERVGIPYETTAGIADFHASGRHSYITELFRNGVSITDARQLARHSDVKMTMRYTHVGLADQAKALAALPATKEADAGQCIGRTDGHPTSDDSSRHDSESHKLELQFANGTSGDQKTSDTPWDDKTGDGDLRHHPLKSGGNRTPMELFLAGLRGWDSEIRRKLVG